MSQTILSMIVPPPGTVVKIMVATKMATTKANGTRNSKCSIYDNFKKLSVPAQILSFIYIQKLYNPENTEAAVGKIHVSFIRNHF